LSTRTAAGRPHRRKHRRSSAWTAPAGTRLKWPWGENPAVQHGAGALVDDPEPGDPGAAGQPLLVGGVDLPDVVRPGGPGPGGAGPPPGGRRGQAVAAEPALDRPLRGEPGRRAGPRQLDADPPGAPAGVEAAEVEGGLPQRRVGRPGPAGAIARQQRGMGPVGSAAEGVADQIPGRARGQAELGGDLGGGGAAAEHQVDGDPQAEVGGAGHRLGLPGLGDRHRLYRARAPTRNIVSLFRTELRVA